MNQYHRNIIGKIIELDEMLDTLYLDCVHAPSNPLIISFVYEVCEIVDHWKAEHDFNQIITSLKENS